MSDAASPKAGCLACVTILGGIFLPWTVVSPVHGTLHNYDAER
jgi:hypothetical protein